MSHITRVTVFCGSRTGQSQEYSRAARDLGAYLAQHGMEMIYGGGNIGLMGLCADAVLEGGGRVTGVMPRQLVEREVAHHGCSELVVVETMDERKSIMIERAQAFIALPGGLGTYDEIFEVLTGFQLHFHRKPLGLLNINDYFSPFINLFEHTRKESFMSESWSSLMAAEESVESLFLSLEKRIQEQ